MKETLVRISEGKAYRVTTKRIEKCKEIITSRDEEQCNHKIITETNPWGNTIYICDLPKNHLGSHHNHSTCDTKRCLGRWKEIKIKNKRLLDWTEGYLSGKREFLQEIRDDIPNRLFNELLEKLTKLQDSMLTIREDITKEYTSKHKRNNR